MKSVTYLKEALSPGGTPTRYLVWVCVILVVQALASIVPSPSFYETPFNLGHALLIAVFLIVIGVNLLKRDKQKILAAYVLYIVGLGLCTATISAEITSLSGIIFMLTWAMTLFVAERREYISFDLVAVFMVLMLVATIVLLMFNPTLGVSDNLPILVAGGTLTAVNIYLVYVDFGFEKNYYQESRKTYAHLEALSLKMSEILSADGELEHLLWRVTQECVPLLELEECVIYLYDEKAGCLKQVAAYGHKLAGGSEIANPLDIEPGKGVVGKCYSTGKSILVDETRNYPDYVIDEVARNSELSVPILSNGVAIGVIDSEHMMKGFFKERHAQAFNIIASFLGMKIRDHQAKKSIELAQIAKEETEKYRELDELKNKFITNISHDLKTPLSLIKAPATQIAQISKSDQVKKQASYILKNAEHLLHVVNQLLQLNRVDKGLNELYLEEINVSTLFEKIAAQYRGLAATENVEFTMRVDPLFIKTDAFRLEQVIHNLVHNAFRYTGRDGKVSLVGENDGDHLRITISDNGPGIAQNLQAKVFDRFFKADINNHEGTGIGLSLVKEYIESLRGKIEMTSEEGKGTSFYVNIPITQIEEANSEERLLTGEVQSEDTRPVMFVVEDHADLNDFVCSFFETKFHCISAFDGEEALQKMEQKTPDIIISDLMMPKMDGSTFISRIRESDQLGHIPIIVLSAKSQTQSRVDLYNLGADNYLVKPFDITELDAVVENVIAQRRKTRQVFRENYLTISTPTTNGMNGESSEDEEPNKLLGAAVEYVKNNLDNSELTIQAMAQELGIGRNRFQKEIKLSTELTPVEFVRSIRLNEAKELLKVNDVNVSEVAFAVGFNNLSYFTRSFKAEFGLLPSQWQEAE